MSDCGLIWRIDRASATLVAGTATVGSRAVAALVIGHLSDRTRLEWSRRVRLPGGRWTLERVEAAAANRVRATWIDQRVLVGW
jgi:hypothetical protein